MQHDTEPCSKCGYELTGLGTRGRCPECGRSFNKISREGIEDSLTPLGQTGRWVDVHLRTLVLLFAGLLLLSCIGAFTFLVRVDLLRIGAIGGVLLAVLVIALVASYVDEM